MFISRRQFVLSAAAIGAMPSLGSGAGAETTARTVSGEKPVFVSTWPFGKAANEKALQVLADGGSLLDAVEQGIWVTESDAENRSVGLSGFPDAAGVVQLDACIMFGPGHKAGSVAAVEGIRHPISVARRVMEKTPHVMLAGDGARQFAIEEGLESVEINSREMHQSWWKKRAEKNRETEEPQRPKDIRENHDTIALLALGLDGSLAGGCSTSGWGGKIPGRVGDSPIIGSGLYVDNEIGAAGATGLGENVMRYCGSFLVVEYMRQGLHPEEACAETIRRIARLDPKGFDLSINFIALDKQGRFGAAGTGQGFEFSVTSTTTSRVLRSPGLSDTSVGPVGGNTK
ncbi:MAG: N(4)-(beta-N-acetylglucosaminyl)-L-asparaginase [Verrucomicrobia bacterium]|nr:N(4)-(beta-N-acetylglucosaminyl)-L-asparaginase [Verrucomicrobiota bacterium]